MLRLKFQEFEDLRSGETLSLLQKVRADSERFINAFINTLFAALVGICRYDCAMRTRRAASWALASSISRSTPPTSTGPVLRLKWPVSTVSG